MIQTNYNPDVLTCLANLSNDEVFTPPNLANEMLDLLPVELWRNPNTTFLDPVTKSGVFLREIAKRLMKGLENQIPDKQQRINHIFTKQLYGIAITELTSLLSRRSVYCSKTANGKYSICDTFTDEQGNIRFERMQHSWQNGKCGYCGANQAEYDREDSMETYAYNFIHTENPDKIFNMKFDVIVGNPPYQLSDGGAQMSASPIYHRFIQQAKKLNPKYMTMIIPARWYNGGKGLDEFRSEMLSDQRIKEIHDFPDTSDCFPGLNIRGGICYFLWDKDYKGDCLISSHKGSELLGLPMKRPLLEKGLDVFVRYNQSISILKKVKAHGENSFSELVSSRKPFGLATNFSGFSKIKEETSNILLHRFGENGFISINKVEKNHSFINDWKIFVPYASPGDDSYPHLILSKPILAPPNTCCTETYLVVGPFLDQEKTKNVAKYMTSKFFRFLILLAKSTQHITQKNYSFVPVQDFKHLWTDEKLFRKYGIDQGEIEFIDSLIRPMEMDYE